MKHLRLLAIALPLLLLPALAQGPPERAVILITLDGARVEEMFGGLDVDDASGRRSRPDSRSKQQPLYQRLLGADPEARREKLMPFFWGTLMRDARFDRRQRGAGQPACGCRTPSGSPILAIRRSSSARAR